VNDGTTIGIATRLVIISDCLITVLFETKYFMKRFGKYLTADLIDFTLVLGHYHLSTIKNMLNLIMFVHPEVKTSRSSIKGHLDAATSASSMLTSRKVF